MHLGPQTSLAVVTTLPEFLGPDDIACDQHECRWADHDVHQACPGALAEIVDVRVWSGIHFRRADEHSVSWLSRSQTGGRRTTSSRPATDGSRVRPRAGLPARARPAADIAETALRA